MANHTVFRHPVFLKMAQPNLDRTLVTATAYHRPVLLRFGENSARVPKALKF